MNGGNRDEREPSYRVQAVERALDIIDCFTFENKELGLSEIVRQTGLNKTTVKRMLVNLINRKYLQQDPNTKRYKLGMRLFELGGIVFSSFSLGKASAHFMDLLQKRTRSTVLLGVIMEEELVYVDKREGNGMVRISSDIGWRRPLHYGMLGMILSAHLEPDKFDEIIDKSPLVPYTARSITDEEEFRNRLEEIRKRGYVIENGEAVEGIIGIAAPIRDYTHKVIAALGIAVPAGHGVPGEELNDFAARVRETCEKISAELGHGS